MSVVVPFLNEELYIEKCIISLLKQDYQKSYELIFIDNGSTDDSVSIVKSYLSDKKIKLYFEKKKNAYAARNLGIHNAKGCVVAFTDADCEVNNKWLKNIDVLCCGNTTLVLGNRLFPSKKGSCLDLFAEYENRKVEYIVSSLTKEYFFGFTNNMAVRKDVFESVGLFNEDFPVAGDVGMVQRVVSEFGVRSVVFSEQVSVKHLEINRLVDWYKKIYVYGAQTADLNSKTGAKALSIWHNLAIFGLVVKKRKLSLIGVFKIGLVYVFGFLIYRWTYVLYR